MKKYLLIIGLLIVSFSLQAQTTVYNGTRIFTGIFRIAAGAQFDFKGNYIVDSQSGDTLATVEGMRTIIQQYIGSYQETDPIYSNDSSKLVMWSDTLNKIVTVKRLIDSLENVYDQIALKLNASDTSRYISKSQARKDIHDSIAPLRVDVRLLQNNPAGIWGNITGTLSNQTDLQNALNAKISFPGFGITGSTAAYGNHTHSGVYQPVGSYLTENQTITLSGDISGSGTTAITVTLPNIATAGTYKSVTVNAKGQVTAGTNPTTLAGYGITDALAKSTTTVANPDSVWVVVDGQAQRAGVTSIPYGYYTNINASGTAYNLTNTSALLDFSTTDPQITITQPGTWKINAGVYINYVGATVTTQTMTFKLRRTNNTAVDVVSIPSLNLTPCASTTGYGQFIQLPPFWYSTSNTNDLLQLWGNISASLSGGNIQVVGAWITAEKIVD